MVLRARSQPLQSLLATLSMANAIRATTVTSAIERIGNYLNDYSVLERLNTNSSPAVERYISARYIPKRARCADAKDLAQSLCDDIVSVLGVEAVAQSIQTHKVCFFIIDALDSLNCH